MGRDHQKIAFQATPWNATAAELLAGAQGSHPSYTLRELESEVMAGTATLFAVIDWNAPEPVLLGYCVVWVETFGGSRELIIQAGEALSNTYRVMPWVMPAFDRLAMDNKCVSIRAHVDVKTRPAMVRALANTGYQKAEIVMRREVG